MHKSFGKFQLLLKSDAYSDIIYITPTKGSLSHPKAMLNMLNLYVNASAAAGGDGSHSNPFSDISSAQNKIRALRAE